MSTKISKLAIIAGSGGYPLAIVNGCIRNNIDFILLPIEGQTDLSMLDKSLGNIYPFFLGEIGKVLSILKSNEISHVICAGSVKKPSLFELKVDLIGAKLLANILKSKVLGDNNILTQVLNFIEDKGYKVVGAAELVPELLMMSGVITKCKPSKDDLNDIEIAKNVAEKLGELDIGQAVIVENKVVLAVEAIEGTDVMLQRSVMLKLSSKTSGILLKSTKPGQDLRVDLPSIGANTIEYVHQAKLKGIAIKSSKSLIINFEQVVDLANKYKIFIIGY